MNRDFFILLHNEVYALIGEGGERLYKKMNYFVCDSGLRIHGLRFKIPNFGLSIGLLGSQG